MESMKRTNRESCSLSLAYSRGAQMEAKEYLLQYRKAKFEAECLDHQLEEINDLIGNVTVDPTVEHVQTSPDPDQIGKLVAKKTDLQAELIEAKAEALMIMQQVMSTINKLNNTDYKRLLQARYIECRSWKRITDSMHYDRRYMFKLHKCALLEIGEIINKTSKDTIDL